MLQVSDLTVNYSAVAALKGVTFHVEPGEIVSILGANGAGKSTILRSISGLASPTGGHILLDGEELRGMPAHRIVQRGVVQCPEGRHIFPECTVLENLELGGYTLKSKTEARDGIDRAFHYFPRLAERRSQLGATLSGGEQQMLGIGRALMSNPRLLLLDEPSLGLAPLVVDQVFQIIRQINRDGMAILLVEQNAHEALHVSRRGYVLETGAILLEGPAEELRQNPRVIEAYLGV